MINKFAEILRSSRMLELWDAGEEVGPGEVGNGLRRL